MPTQSVWVWSRDVVKYKSPRDTEIVSGWVAAGIIASECSHGMLFGSPQQPQQCFAHLDGSLEGLTAAKISPALRELSEPAS